jgi:hypothetical protein
MYVEDRLDCRLAVVGYRFFEIANLHREHSSFKTDDYSSVPVVGPMLEMRTY